MPAAGRVPSSSAGQGCRLAAACLWERLVRRGHVRRAADSWGVLFGSHKRGSGMSNWLIVDRSFWLM